MLIITFGVGMGLLGYNLIIKAMKKLIFLLLILSACQKDELIPVHMTATGTRNFNISWYDHSWNDLQVTDTWSGEVYASPGDTVKLSAHGNEYPVELHLDSIGVVIMPGGYLEMKFIVK